ncbi:FAD-binding oxidoreductase [Salinimicrobium gaetbulicola]|uniref:FAD-binding oxidoreductase n=1 Tax=Salinimicrobium gaetbulicola TaxID=999702 RepID=A0ABW3IEX0_9FLAO
MDIQGTEKLRSEMEGPVLLPGDEGYDEARALWNGMFDKKPAVIAQCKSTRDVVSAVNFARENELLVAVKGGGHNSAGTGSCDDGLMIDLSLMNKVEVDKDTQIVTAQGGALLSEVDAETQKHGLAVSSGIISHTGVGGLTLGGGFGWISRKFGLTIDSLVSAEVVTADGKVVTASESENPDLFWGIRGGGGNFGVVTSFRIKTHKIGNEVFSGVIVKKFEALKEYMRFFRSYVRKMPDEITIWLVVRHAPPLPFIPEEYHGKLVALIPFVYLGEKEKGEELIQPVRDAEETIGDGSGMHPWTAWQQGFDPLVEHGARNYWKSHHIKELSDECIDVIYKFAQSMPSQECEIFVPHMEGAPSRVSSDATAFPHRNTPFVLNIHTRWRDEADDKKALKWAKDFHEETEPFSQGVYVNFLSDEGSARVRQAYTEEVWEKLVEVKRKWDPNNLFKVNQNIDPQSSWRQHDLVH